MFNSSNVQPNTFQETMLALEYECRQGYQADLFSRACVYSYSTCDWTRFGYCFTQIFEPSVLREVAILEGVPYDSLSNLTYRPSSNMTRLAELNANAADVPLITLVNVASALISISRFDVAARLLASVPDRITTSREMFEVAWLEFMVSNRCNNGNDSPTAFAKMHKAIDIGGIPRGRVLDACTQAVVWYTKRRELPEDEVKWWLVVGNNLAKTSSHCDSGTVSSWYRGLAMLPAAKGRAAETRRYMELARETAELAIAQRPGAYELNTIKTYYESTMKEHMYVTKDRVLAEEAGRALIDLDPAWAPSYGELAEMYRHFGQVARAAEFYEQAVKIGPPYLGYHLLQAARARVQNADDELALAHYLTLAELAPQNERVLKEGLEVARRVSSESRTHFEGALSREGTRS